LKDKLKLLPGYSLRIIDSHRLSGTEHRIKKTRYHSALPLLGFTLAILAPDSRMIIDSISCEEGHAQDCSLTSQMIDGVQQGKL
jgi:hypothetical protein